MRHAMAGHRGALKSLDLKKDGKVAVTCKFTLIVSSRIIERIKNFQNHMMYNVEVLIIFLSF